MARIIPVPKTHCQTNDTPVGRLTARRRGRGQTPFSTGGSRAVAQTACGFGLASLNLHRIGLSVFPFNTRGICCYEKCGFQHEGRKREALFKHGQYHDLMIMGLLVCEYQELWPQRWEKLCAPGQTLGGWSKQDGK